MGGYIALFPPEREGKNIDGGKNLLRKDSEM